MAVNKIETVEIVKDLVTLLVTELTGSGSWVDNSDGTFTLPICRTYWLKAQDIVTIDSVEYKVSNVTRDSSLTILSDTEPTLTSFYLDAPSFYHGTIVQTNQELSKDAKDVTERTPMAYLYRDLEDDFKSSDNSLDRETPIRLFFLHDTNFTDYTTEKTDEETLEPMRSLAYFFVEEILKKSKQLGKIEDYSIRDYLRFGVENQSGYTQNIFNDNFSGVELNITLPIKAQYVCSCDELKSKIKYIDSDASLKSVNYGETIVCTPCGGGVINVSNSNDTYSVNTLVDLELPDITHTNSDGSPITLPAQTPLTCTPCVVNTINVSNSNDTYSVNTTTDLELPDITHTDSDLSSVVLPAQTPMICTPQEPLYRSSEVFKSGQTTFYTTGDDGDLELGNGADFYTLSENNGFGNTARFTDLSGVDWNGGGSPTGSLAIDWSTWNRVDDKVAVWNIDLSAIDTWANGVSWGLVDNLSTGFANGWHLPNINESLTIMDFEISTLPMFFLSNGSDFWTSTTEGINGANAFYCRLAKTLQTRAKSNSEPARQLRYYTLTELGL